MECSKAFAVVFVGLVLATAGFCLTLAGWFAPPINDYVKGVRLTGPILLVIGILVLLFSCIMCAISQHLCCVECAHYCYNRHGDTEQERLARTVHLNVNHADRRPMDTNNPLILEDMQDAFDACNMVSANKYAKSSPSCDTTNRQSRVNGHSRDAFVGANRTATGHDFNYQSEQSKSSEAAAPAGYHESEATTDSTETPSTSPVRQPSSYDVIMTTPELHTTMYEGMGVRVKQFKSKNLPNKNPDEGETRHLLDQYSHSASPSPYSSPHWSTRHKDRHVRSSRERDEELAPPSSSMDSSTFTQTQSDHSIVLPKPGTFRERDPNKTSSLTTPRTRKEEGPVWTPRTTRWGSSSLRKNSSSPPPYRDPFVMHSDV